MKICSSVGEKCSAPVFSAIAPVRSSISCTPKHHLQQSNSAKAGFLLVWQAAKVDCRQISKYLAKYRQQLPSHQDLPANLSRSTRSMLNLLLFPFPLLTNRL